MSLTYKARLYLFGVSSPAISKHPRAFLYGWLPLSNAYGISSVATQHKPYGYRHFFNQNMAPIRLPISISSLKQKTATPGLEQALRIRVSNATKF